MFRHLCSSIIVSSLTVAIPLYLRTPYADDDTGRLVGSLVAEDVATILGDTDTSARLSGVRSLAPRIKPGLDGDGFAKILGKSTGSWRAQMIAVIAGSAKQGLVAEDVATILGDTDTSARLSGVRSLAPRIKQGLNGIEIETILANSTGSWRAQMIAVIADYSRDGAEASPPAKLGAVVLDNSGQSPAAIPADAKHESEKLKSRIDRMQKAIPEPPEYLYGVSTFSEAVSTVFMDITAPLRGANDIRDKYDEFYLTAVEYRALIEQELILADRYLQKGDMETAQRHYDQALRYNEQFNMSSAATFEVYNGNLDSAYTLAEGIYEGSKAAAKFGARLVPSPTAARVVDYLYMATDFYVNTASVGLNSAQQELITDVAVQALMNVKTPSLGGKSLADALEQDTTKLIGSSGLYDVMDDIMHNPDFQKELMRTLANSGAAAVDMITESQLEAVLEQMKASANATE